MEESRCYQSEFRYELPAFREFSKLNVEAHYRNTFLFLFGSACVIYLTFLLNYLTSPVTLLLLSLLWLGLHLFRWFRGRNGGLDYQRMVRSNNGIIPTQIVLVDESGIKSRNPDTGKDICDSFDSIRYMMESKNLLILVNDLKMCHIIDKTTLQGGCRGELVAFLRQKCPKLKKHIRTGKLGRISKYLCIAANVIALVFSLAHLLHIPEKLSGELTNDLTYQQMAQELAPLGITISDQTIRELEEYDAEYAAEYGDYYKENPYASKVLDMLYWEGAGIYDEETGLWTPSASGVYWFDMEVYDVSCMYTDFLTGVDAMDENLTFSNITEDYSRADLESGQGIVIIGFDYQGKHYDLSAKYDYDWFDTEILRELAVILDSDEAPEKLWYSLDGQALFLYYGTTEQAEVLETKTGAIWLDPVHQTLYN